jgi:hypothetical protein
LAEGFDPAQPPSPAQLSSPISHPGTHPRTLPLPPQHPGSATSVFGRTPPTTATASNPINAFRGPQFDSARSGPDSDDSDIAEITSRDFQLHNGLASMRQSNPRHLTPYPPLRTDQGTGRLIPGTYPYHDAMPGPSNAGNSESSMWAHPASAALATWNAAKNHIGGIASSLAPDHVRDVIDLVSEHYGNTMSRADIA